jgi:hypothetical protein
MSDTKSCMMCGTDNEVAARYCVSCNYEFKFYRDDQGVERSAGDPAAASPSPAVSDRPNGGAPMAIGWTCLALSILCLLIAVSGPSSYGGGYSMSGAADAAARSFLGMAAASGLFSMFLIFWSVGYIVRAISFLPGKES